MVFNSAMFLRICRILACAIGVLAFPSMACANSVPRVAQAARPARLMPGLYSYPGGPPPNPLITFDVLKIKGGREVAADALVTCKSRWATRAGIPANHPLVLRIPHSLPIIGHRTFTYSGLVRVFRSGTFQRERGPISYSRAASSA